ncbi:hypothetical protein PFICI_00355 [Pestalotiopsis fici W106-1]|uniref:Rhodopsin domain-containing protein n=1 Tax=Pestalotiopsis fici (strain W106-1 / CGMCC3.15140) TaxID=1229662 RepID=W3XM15_PESFW|nr:uncharacterized protein PFICI_00355 [Pestalotiopsis fici W106-1]ETS86527.1 hypothetical protein PFICI_00355 [Pestalotiopsis fici W106-1]
MDRGMALSTLVAAIVTYYVSLVFYRLFFHPLAVFPGPKLAAISRWYEAYYDVVLKGQYTRKIADLHREYGPIIRISPHELHVHDPAFFGTLYRVDGRWDKYTWTYDAFGAKSSTVFGSDHDLHKTHRRAIAPFFAKTKVLGRQEMLRRNTKKLSLRMTSLIGTTFNLGAAISAFTRDNINEYVIGKSYNETDHKDFNVALSIASQGAGVFWRTTKHVRWFGPTMRAMPIDWAMKIADDGTKAFLRYVQNSERDTQDTMAAAEASDPDSQYQNSMIHEMVHSALPSSEKTFDHIFEEVATVTSAGFETTANVLRLILFHIYANDHILQMLRKELSSLQPAISETVTLRQLEQLPYLTATIKEGLRLSPGIASRMARITNQELYYNNWRIPAGTPTGMTTILLHTDPKLYPSPLRFNPDRWIESPETQSLDAVFAPFSSGTRTCLGIHLAWAEIYLLIAELVQNFNFIIKDATASDFELEMDNFGIGTKAGCNLTKLRTTFSALWTFSDLTIVLLPVMVIWRLQMTLRQRIGLVLLMSVSLFTTAMSILRAVGLNHIADQQSGPTATDVQYNASLEILWACLEQACVILMGCVPSLRSVVRLEITKSISSSLSKDPALLSRQFSSRDWSSFLLRHYR